MKHVKTLVSIAILLTVAGLILYQTVIRDEWRAPSIVKIAGDVGVGAIFPSPLTWMTGAEPDALTALLLRDGDIILGKGDLFIPYDTDDGLALELRSGGGTMTLAGKTVAASLYDDSGLQWLDQASDLDLARLRMIELPHELAERETAVLKRIAAINPHVALLSESESSLDAALEFLDPRCLLAIIDYEEGNSTPKWPRSLPELETLYLLSDNIKNLDFLAYFPQLQRLALVGSEDGEIAPIPAGLSNLKSLIVFGAPEVSFLTQVPATLEDLALSGDRVDPQFPIQVAERLKGLRTLSVVTFDDEPLDLTPFMTLEKLRWAGLPGSISQQQFEAFTGAHPDLEVLELLESDTKLDLAPLRSMPDLQALVLTSQYDNLEVIKELRSLRFIGVTEELFEDSPATIAAIREALPDAIVVPISPFCLGSGWILLLIPALSFAWMRAGPRARVPVAA